MKTIDIDTIVANGGHHIPLTDSEAVATDKMFHNIQVRKAIEAKAVDKRTTAVVDRAKAAQERLQASQREAWDKFNAEEAPKRRPRMFAWLLVLAGCYYIPMTIQGGLSQWDITTVSGALFSFWALLWCGWGFMSILQEVN